MLTSSCLGDDTTLAHPPREEDLADGIVDFVRARMQKVLSLEVNLRSASVRCQPLRREKRRWPTAIIAQQLFQLVPEVRIVARAGELFRQLLKWRH